MHKDVKCPHVCAQKIWTLRKGKEMRTEMKRMMVMRACRQEEDELIKCIS